MEEQNSNNYWTRANGRLSRRKLLGGASAAAAGLAGLAVVGCGDDDDDGGGDSGGAAPSGTQAPQKTAAGIPPSGAPKPGGTMVIDFSLTPPHFDPHLTTLGGTTLGAAPAYSRLTTFKMGFDVRPGALEIAPDLAEKWEQPSPTEYVFKLRNNAFWHEGDPMNGRKLVAEDIKYSFEREMNPDTKSPHRYIFSRVSKMEATDPTTLKVTMSEPDVDFQTLISGADAVIMGREGIEKYGDLKQHFAGSGAYMFDGYDEGAEVRYKKNPKYFLQGQPYLDGVKVRIVTDASARMSSFLGKQSDVFGIFGNTDGQTLKVLQDSRKDLVVSDKLALPSSTGQNLFMSAKWEPAKDPRVREAIIKGVDREELIKVAFFGDGFLQGPMPAGFKDDALPEAEIKKYFAYDPQKAKQLLQAAGRDGLSATITYYVYGESDRTVAQQLKQQLEKIGMKIALQEIEYGTQTATLVSHDYELRRTPQPGFLTPGQFMALYGSKNGNNWSGFGFPELDAMIKTYGGEFDTAKRRELGFKMQRFIFENQIVDDLASQYTYFAMPQHVKNWPFHNTYGWLQLKAAWIDKA